MNGLIPDACHRLSFQCSARAAKLSAVVCLALGMAEQTKTICEGGLKVAFHAYARLSPR